nr:MAG TPA: hypothetical protein [Caudoviricetes sp.]
MCYFILTRTLLFYIINHIEQKCSERKEMLT